MLQRTVLLTALCAVTFCSNLRAGILGDALTSFPAQTEYLEDDNLAALRALPYYATLRNNFSGASLEEVQTVLRQLGISETGVGEIVTGSKADATYGLVTGSFSSKDPAINSRLKLYGAKLLDTKMYCVGRASCILFLEDSLVAFGAPDSLKLMLLARQGVLNRLSTNAEAVRLLETGDKTSPVRGILFGAQLQSALSDTLQQWFGKRMQSMKLPATVTGVGYDVTFGTLIRLRATLQCTSATSAGLLAQTLNVLSSLQPLATPVHSSNGFAFERAKALSTGSRIQLEADASSPNSKRKE